MQRITIILTAFMAALTLGASEPQAEEICNVSGLITSMIGKDGPLERCNEGDVAHFQINVSYVSPATVAARYCDFDSQIFTDIYRDSTTGHLVCKYKWKWAKEVNMKKHPDAK